MDNVTAYVGLDYHQDSIQVCVMDASGRELANRSCENDPVAVAEAVHASSAPGTGVVPAALAIEACTGAADFAEALIELTGWTVHLAHPTYVARLKGSPDKSDYTDGRLLADLARVGYLPRTWLAPASVRDLRRLVSYRQSIVDARRAVKLRIGSLLREQRVKVVGVNRWTKAWVAQMREHAGLSESARWIIGEQLEELEHLSVKLASVQARLMRASEDDATVARLLEIEGVGPVTAWWLRAYVGRFDRFRTGKQLSRYCGLSPRNASSGSRTSDGGLIHAAHRQLRSVLIQAAHRLVRMDARWSALACRLMDKGKAKNVAVAAVANRWVRTVHHRMVAGVAA